MSCVGPWEGRFKGADLASRGFFFWSSPLDTRPRRAGLNFRNHLRPLGNPENESNCLANGTKITSWVSLMTHGLTKHVLVSDLCFFTCDRNFIYFC